MRIEIERTGGFAGLTEILVPSKVADDAVREHLARLEALLARGGAPTGADFQRYEISIAADGGPSRVLTVVDDGREDDPAMALVRAILALLA